MKIMRSLLTIALVSAAIVMHGQANFKVEVSADTIASGEIVEVSYTIENGEGKFEMPDLRGLPLISGPNTSSSFTIINGQKSSSQTYSFFFKAGSEDRIEIPAAKYYEDDDVRTLEPVTIVVGERHTEPSMTSAKPDPLAKREKKKI